MRPLGEEDTRARYSVTLPQPHLALTPHRLDGIPSSKVWALDRDKAAIQRSCWVEHRFKDRFCIQHAPFSRIAEACTTVPYDGVLFDLGVSSDQVSLSSVASELLHGNSWPRLIEGSHSIPTVHWTCAWTKGPRPSLRLTL